MAGASAQRGARADPIGVWSCLMYGRSDQRFYLKLTEDENVHIAGITDAMRGTWRPSSTWRTARGWLFFSKEGKRLSANLRRSSLGGTWDELPGTGGWWCARVTAAGVQEKDPPRAGGLMPALVPAIMASPNYPRQAIREAKEGRAVSCFFVNGKGEISDAELVELTDEIFREPTLVAVSRSRYREWGDEHLVAPACRSFTYELRAMG